VCISSKFNINSYVGYCKAQFLEEHRPFVVVKARAAAIETALKVVQLVKENIGGIHSNIELQLQAKEDLQAE
jgi:DNA-binding protein